MEKKGEGRVIFSVEYFCLKKVMLRRVMPPVSVENFLSNCTETLCRGTFLCCVSENILRRKSLWIRRGGEISQFSVENFVFHSAKKFRREPLLCCVSENIWWRKSVRIRRGA